MEDQRIIDLYLDRDENAILYTAEKYGRRLQDLAFSVTEDRASAEECENDTYMKAWTSIPPYEPRDYFYAFLARITRHLALDICRSRSRIKRSAYVTELTEEMEMCIPASGSVEQDFDEKQLGKYISSFLLQQSKERRVMFVKRYFYMESITDISTAMKLGESKVKTTLFRMRSDLRKYLEKEGYII